METCLGRLELGKQAIGKRKREENSAVKNNIIFLL